MIERKEINSKANVVDRKARELSDKMSKHDYVITEEKINPALKKMTKIIRMMGFNKDQTNSIMESVRKDIIGKEMHKGDNFHEIIKESFTTALTKAIEGMKNGNK